MQGGPGVFKGDLHFYTADGDVRARVAEIDTGKCPLYLLTGEYDYSCTPADTRDLAARIKGAEATIMEGLGHFPVSEDPARFLAYLRPVLAEACSERKEIYRSHWLVGVCRGLPVGGPDHATRGAVRGVPWSAHGRWLDRETRIAARRGTRRLAD